MKHKYMHAVQKGKTKTQRNQSCVFILSIQTISYEKIKANKKIMKEIQKEQNTTNTPSAEHICPVHLCICNV